MSKYCSRQSRELAGVIVGWNQQVTGLGKQPYLFVNNHKRLVLAMVFEFVRNAQMKSNAFSRLSLQLGSVAFVSRNCGI